MTRLTTSLMIAALACALASGTAQAQQAPANPPAARAAPATTTVPMKKAEPTAWDKTKAMSRKQWNEAKAKWAMEKEQWKDCTDQSKKQNLRGTKRWTFIGNCMTKS